MTAYYNEIDPYKAQWLRHLILCGVIAPGDVDERNIKDVKPNELKKYTQCHFFAGVGVWSYALRLAGWPDNKPVVTGSCPCQPFSNAGRSRGFADERHVWPYWFHIITQLQPNVIFGEQVASKDGLNWFELVSTDLENANYAAGCSDLCAAGVGSPNIRQRLYFVGERLGDAFGEGLERHARHENGTPGRSEPVRPVTASSEFGGLADTDQNGRDQRWKRKPATGDDGVIRNGCVIKVESSTVPTSGVWGDPDWLFCRDGKFRPVESGTFPLVDGAPARVGRLRAYGDAINAEVAKNFIEAYLDYESQ